MSVDHYLADGRRFLAEKRYACAAQAFQKVVLLEPGSMVASVNLLGLKGLRPELEIHPVVIRTVAVVAPDNPSVLYNQGEILRIKRRPLQAIRWFRRSLVIRPDGRNGWFKLAAAQEQLQNPEQMSRTLRRAYSIEPGSDQIIKALVGVMLHQKQADKALGFLDSVSASVEPNIGRERLRIRALIHCSRIDEALELVDTALAEHPLDQGLWMLRALGERNQGRNDASVRDGRRSLLIRPDADKALNQHAMTMVRSEKLIEGIACLRRHQVSHPEQALRSNGLIGSALVELGEVETGIHHLRKGCVAIPENAEVLSNLCAAYVTRQMLDKARVCVRRGRVITQDSADLIYNHALVERFSGHIEAALVNLKVAMALKPDDPVYQFTGSLLELGDGDPIAGISHHQHRWRMPKFSAVRRIKPEPDLPVPVWDGRRLAGTLAIWGEQGVGDELWFSGYLRHAIDLADKVVLEVSPHMVRLMERSFPDITVLPRHASGTEERLKQADAQRPLGDLFDLFFRLDDPIPVGYLTPDRSLAHQLRARYLDGSEAGTRLVGISWRSRKGIAKRSFTAPIEQWGPVLAPSTDEALWGRQPVRFVSLQYGDVTEDLEAARRLFGRRILYDSAVDPLKDLDAAAAQVMAMDGVISVANATVALTHALGRRCAVATRIDQDDWRYPRLTAQSRWLPNARHFWQAAPQDWSQALKGASRSVAEQLLSSGVTVDPGLDHLPPIR